MLFVCVPMINTILMFKVSFVQIFQELVLPILSLIKYKEVKSEPFLFSIIYQVGRCKDKQAVHNRLQYCYNITRN